MWLCATTPECILAGHILRVMTATQDWRCSTFRPSIKLLTSLMLRRLNDSLAPRSLLGVVVLPKGLSCAVGSMPHSASRPSMRGGSMPPCMHDQ